MGYKPVRKIYNLSFEEYPGLEVVMGSMALGKLMDVAKLQLRLNEPDEAKRLEIFKLFSDKLIRWNVEHPENEETELCPRCGMAEGTELPATIDGLLCLDLEFIMAIVFGWISTLSRVNPGKGMNLNNGENNIQEEVMKQLAMMQSPMTSRMPS